MSVERVLGPPFSCQLSALETEGWQQIAHLINVITAFWIEMVIQRKYRIF